MGDVVLVAAGGTGGHVFPGLATAHALAAARPDLDIEFVGTADRLEARLVPDAGFRLHTVPAMALSRRLSPATVRLPGVLLGAVRRVVRLIRERHVIAAVGFGGYTSVPLALAARVTGTALVVHEQNAVPGVANRLAGRLAAVVAVSFPEAATGFGGTRTVLTGNPVRPDLLAAVAGSAQERGSARSGPPSPDGEVRRDPGAGGQDDDDPIATAAGIRDALRPEALRTFGLDPARRTLLVFGGSQGALRINTAITQSVAAWTEPGRLQVLHAAGARTHADTRAAWQAAGVDPDGATADGDLKVVCREFIDRMDLAYAAADVVVCRAGASSIAELTALAIPAVMVPYPHATADHQTANARAVARAGGAVVVPDADLDAAALVRAAEPLLLDDDRHLAMREGSASFGRPDAARALAALVLEVADDRPPTEGP
ncbi:glycosyltransferase [Euzebya sp.]|uniref:UDP-N-acetylglucosamine--N-acetylmuramyl- (pentapeptide) pyrophosphoryl-undecaprenol N-acetylglucosamine transferase n=1 Tax=Euzebya sp. TaxID=1971409 RepID=UPI0035141DD0